MSTEPRQVARDYLVEWGNSIWKETEYRVIEQTKDFEEQLGKKLESIIGVSAVTGASLSGSIEKIRKLSETEKAQIVERGQQVVHSLQIKVLSDVISLLEDELSKDRVKKYYITLDRLDENWVDDSFRHALIRSLLETIRELNRRLGSVKIIVALRRDLIDRVFRQVNQPGYQGEKIDSICLNLIWKKNDLEDLLEKRVQQYFRKQYGIDESPGLHELFTKPKGIDPVGFILSRTMLRPRDAILFFNCCINAAIGRSKVGANELSVAEKEYSESRLASLGDEWSATYPMLVGLVRIVQKFPASFKFDHLIKNKTEIETRLIDYLSNVDANMLEKDKILSIINQKLIVTNDGFSADGFKNLLSDLLSILFDVGVIGVKPENYDGVRWSYEGQKWIAAEIDASPTFTVHPMFWRALLIQS